MPKIDTKLSWSQVREVAYSMGMGLAVRYIDIALDRVGGADTWEDVCAVGEILGIQATVTVIEAEALKTYAIERIINSEETTANKIRKMIDMGLERTRIAQLLGVRYQQVRNVEIRTYM